MGDIAATLADLAAREAILTEETPAGGWLVSVNDGFDDRGLAGFEKVLLHDLPRSPEPIGGIGTRYPSACGQHLSMTALRAAGSAISITTSARPAPKDSPGSCAPSTGNCGSGGSKTGRRCCPEACCRTPSTSGWSR